MTSIGNARIGFIGFGNMAQALAQGILGGGLVDGARICACARDGAKLAANAARIGVSALTDAASVAQASDIVILAVKPYQMADVTAPLRDVLADKIVLTVAAGINFEQFDAMLAPGTHHLSFIPNTPVSVGQGIHVIESRDSLTDDERALVCQILGSCGLVVPMETRLMGTAMTIASCGPAFAAMVIEALGDAGVKHGLPRTQAYQLAAQMLAGTGELCVRTGQHPAAMKDAVCSPGGSTIRGVAALERAGLRAALIDAVDAVEG